MEQKIAKKDLSINKSVIGALASGTISSTVTTIVYQPLELLKTRIQLRSNEDPNNKIFGRLTKSAIFISKSEGIKYLWRGTGPSLLRSVPGVGLYYALLNVLQTNLSNQNHKPDNPTQAFYFGLTARSLISFMLLPVTVIKVRYESGRFDYPSLGEALKSGYLNSNGWVGMSPTILRDSLFSGTYYMCYTKLKSSTNGRHEEVRKNSDEQPAHMLNFIHGMISGLIASIVTNPIDVVKTNVQVANKKIGQPTVSTLQVVKSMLTTSDYIRFFDGLAPRSLRRALIAATTWTFYELMIDLLKNSRMV